MTSFPRPLPQNAVRKFHPRSAGDGHPHLMISFFLHLTYSITRVPITRGPTTVPRGYHRSLRCSAPSPRHRYTSNPHRDVAARPRVPSRGFVLWRVSHAGPKCAARSVMGQRPKTIAIFAPVGPRESD
jgi:hypothetical protein